MAFQRNDLSKLRSRRRRLERRVERLSFQLTHDPMVDLVRVSTSRDKLRQEAAKLTLQIAAELHGDERRKLRKELLAHV